MPHRPHILIMQSPLGLLSPLLESAYNVYRLWEHPPVEAQNLIQAAVVLGEAPLDTAVIERLPNLKLLACFTSGYDGIDLEWCAARGLPVTHAPAVNHEDVADHAVGLILASVRRIVDGGDLQEFKELYGTTLVCAFAQSAAVLASLSIGTTT